MINSCTAHHICWPFFTFPCSGSFCCIRSWIIAIIFCHYFTDKYLFNCLARWCYIVDHVKVIHSPLGWVVVFGIDRLDWVWRPSWLSIISPFIISGNNSFLLLSRVALPNILPSVMSWSKLSCLRTCPSHLCFLRQIVFNMLLASLARTNTSFFVTFSVQLIFSILHHVRISDASNSFYRTSICEGGLGSRNFVRLSVRPSVTHVDCDKTKWCTADILIPHERAITLLL